MRSTGIGDVTQCNHIQKRNWSDTVWKGKGNPAIICRWHHSHLQFKGNHWEAIITNKGANRKKLNIRNTKYTLIHIGINTHMHNSMILSYYGNDQLENIIFF